MTESTRLERDLPGILGDLSMSPPTESLDDVFARTARMRQRPAWTFPERWIPMADIASRPAYAPRLPWRALGMALIIIALIAGAAVAFVASQRTRLPEPFGPAANGLIPYVSDGDIYVGDPVTGAVRLVVGGPENDGLPQTSPDGTRISFLREAGAGPGPAPVDLYVVGFDGSGLHKVTTEPIADWRWVSWMPDGRRVALIQSVPSSEPCAETLCQVNQLDLFDASGSKPAERIAAAVGIDSLQFRPPAGDQLLFRALVDGKYGLFTSNDDGTNLQTIVPATVPQAVDNSFGSAVYSADGERILYQHGDADGCCQLWVMNADGTNQHEFLPRGPAWDGSAVVSPDGKLVAYWHNPNDGEPHGISVVSADGTGQPVETGPMLEGTAHWIWSPDSTKILMFPNDTDIGSAYLLDPAGGPWTTVQWGSIGDLDWQRLALAP